MVGTWTVGLGASALPISCHSTVLRVQSYVIRGATFPTTASVSAVSNVIDCSKKVEACVVLPRNSKGLIISGMHMRTPWHIPYVWK
jgi:hypothetical protein